MVVVSFLLFNVFIKETIDMHYYSCVPLPKNQSKPMQLLIKRNKQKKKNRYAKRINLAENDLEGLGLLINIYFKY